MFVYQRVKYLFILAINVHKCTHICLLYNLYSCEINICCTDMFVGKSEFEEINSYSVRIKKRKKGNMISFWTIKRWETNTMRQYETAAFLSSDTKRTKKYVYMYIYAYIHIFNIYIYINIIMYMSLVSMNPLMLKSSVWSHQPCTSRKTYVDGSGVIANFYVAKDLWILHVERYRFTNFMAMLFLVKNVNHLNSLPVEDGIYSSQKGTSRAASLPKAL